MEMENSLCKMDNLTKVSLLMDKNMVMVLIDGQREMFLMAILLKINVKG
jgi:hypothetical protein